MLEIKTLTSEMKNSFDGMISRSDTTEERMKELESRLINMIQTDTQREKKSGAKKQNRHIRDLKQYEMAQPLGNWSPKKENREMRVGEKKYLGSNG